MRKDELIDRLLSIPSNSHVLIPLPGHRKWFVGVDQVKYQPSKRHPEHRNAGVITLERVRPVRIPTGWRDMKKGIPANRFNARDARRLTNEAKDRHVAQEREENAKRVQMYVTANLQPELNKILTAIQMASTRGEDQYSFYHDHVNSEPLLNEVTRALRELKFTVDDPVEVEDGSGWTLYIYW